MVQRKAPDKLGIQATVKNLYEKIKSHAVIKLSSSQNSGPELKKMIKKSRSIKRSDPVTSTKRRTKPQSTNKSPPPTDVPVAAPVSTPKKLNPVKLPETSPMRSTPIKLRDASPNHMKPTPVKLPDASPNYMKSTTSSYNARKERSQVSPQGLVMRMV